MKATGSLLCFLCCAATASAARTTAGGLVHDLPTANTATSSNTGLAWQSHAHTNTHASSKAGLTTNPDCSHVTCSIKKHTCAKFNRNAQAWSPQPGAAFQWNGNHNSPFASGQALTHNFDSDECDGTAHYSVVVNHHNSESVCTAASGGHHCGMGVLTGGSACECKPGKVNGAWGAWGTFSSCVNGVRTRTRECNNPAPRDGGSLCVGNPLDEDSAGCHGNVYLLVPTGNNSPGHEHTANEQPNKIDPAGGWTDTGETYQEDNGIKRRLWTKPLAYGMQLYHTVNLGWGYAYFASGKFSIRDDTNSNACGPYLVSNANANTNINCDRDYKVGFGNFFNKYGTLTLIQDAHDPNDHNWPVNTRFVTITHRQVFLLVPAGNNSPGHEHTANEQPNKIDPAGGWTDTGETYQEDNGIKRRLWTKPLTDGMQLYHTVNLGWGYLYFVAGTSISITDSTGSTACGPNLIKDANANTNTNCDRNYKVGSSDFFSKYGTMSLIQDAHDPNDHHWPVNTKFVTVHA